MSSQDGFRDLDAVGTLAEPTRRAIYEFVVGAGTWVGRDRVAEALGLERGTAAHHLDRLATDGLLDFEFRRLSGRRGPGAGRPAKLYRRAASDFHVSLPPRDYLLAGRLLAAAADRAHAENIDIVTALDDIASAEGRRLGEAIRADLGTAGAARSDRRRTAVLAALEAHGFEPRTADDGTIELANCPFHLLAQDHTELVCGMNRCLLDAAVDEVGDTGLEARLEPEDGRCCVTLHPTR